MRDTGTLLFMTHVGEPGGAELKMIELCRAVRGRAEVMLFQHGSLQGILRRNRIPVRICAMPEATQEVRREAGALSILRAIPGVLSMIRDVARQGRRFDAIVCFSQKAFVLAALAKPFMRRPILWFMNDILSREHFSRPLIRLLVLLSRYSADRIVLNSQASLKAWRDAGGHSRSVSIIYPGVREEQLAEQLQDPLRIAHYREKYSPHGRPLVGMFGRIGHWKGQEVFLRAIARLPEVNAVIVGGAFFGEEEFERKIRALASQLNLDGRVTFTGHMSEPLTVMAACDVVAHCSTAPEPFGLVIAEAMWVGIPVIASDAGGAREIVIPDETGQLTPLRDHEALARAIDRCFADPQWVRETVRRARARAHAKFSNAAMTARFLATLEAL